MPKLYSPQVENQCARKKHKQNTSRQERARIVLKGPTIALEIIPKWDKQDHKKVGSICTTKETITEMKRMLPELGGEGNQCQLHGELYSG